MSAMVLLAFHEREFGGVQSVSIWAMSKMEKMSYLNDQYFVEKV